MVLRTFLKYGSIDWSKPLDTVRNRSIWNRKGQKGVEAEETRLAQVGGRREEKNSRQLNEILFGVKNEWGELLLL